MAQRGALRIWDKSLTWRVKGKFPKGFRRPAQKLSAQDLSDGDLAEYHTLTPGVDGYLSAFGSLLLTNQRRSPDEDQEAKQCKTQYQP